MPPRLDPNTRALRAITERTWQETVVQHARTAGWLVSFLPDSFHARAKADGSFFAIKQGDKGFPDLVMVNRNGDVLYRELKRETGKLSPDQEEWRDRLQAGGHDWDVWKPSDLDEKVIPTLYDAPSSST